MLILLIAIDKLEHFTHSVSFIYDTTKHSLRLTFYLCRDIMLDQLFYVRKCMQQETNRSIEDHGFVDV